MRVTENKYIHTYINAGPKFMGWGENDLSSIEKVKHIITSIKQRGSDG